MLTSINYIPSQILTSSTKTLSHEEGPVQFEYRRNIIAVLDSSEAVVIRIYSDALQLLSARERRDRPVIGRVYHGRDRTRFRVLSFLRP